MSESDRVANGKLVRFSYQITDDRGEVLERIDTPMSCVFGHHNRFYDRVEAAMLGLPEQGEVAVDLPPNECAWGNPDPGLVFAEAKQNVPAEYQVIGAEVAFKNDQGESKVFRVVGVDDTTITFDGNHPFAGKVVTYQVKILEVRDATPLELAEGVESGLPSLSDMAVSEKTMH